MKRCAIFHSLLCLIAILPVTAPAVMAGAGCLVPDDAYRAISDYVLAGDYAAAEAGADSLIARYPDEPAGHLFKAAVIQYESTDYEDPSREDEFLALTGESARLARECMQEDPDDLWAVYFLGASEGMEGAWKVASGGRVSGILQGRAGSKRMAGIVERDPSFYDACLLLGSYRFWSGTAMSRLAWLPFIGDNSDEGLELVETAIARGRLSGPLSNTVYIEMLLESDPFAAAESAERLLARYPDCRLFAWQLGEAYKKLERYDDAVAVFTDLAARYAVDPCDDGSGKLRAWWKLAVLAKTVGKTEECAYFCRKVTAFGDDHAVRERQSRRIGEASDMLKEFEDE